MHSVRRRLAYCSLLGFSRIGLKVETAPDWNDKLRGETCWGFSAMDCFLLMLSFVYGAGAKNEAAFPMLGLCGMC